MTETSGAPPLKAILLDMDGVLVDVSGSYRRVIAETFEHFAGRPLAEGATQAKKDEGGYNNDWVLTHALLIEAGVDVQYDDVVAVFEDLYRGDDYSGLHAAGDQRQRRPGGQS
ncbi:MAG: hypothetical protein AAFQ43_07135, partial [Bacteroidota bacterium]